MDLQAPTHPDLHIEGGGFPAHNFSFVLHCKLGIRVGKPESDLGEVPLMAECGSSKTLGLQPGLQTEETGVEGACGGPDCLGGRDVREHPSVAARSLLMGKEPGKGLSP